MTFKALFGQITILSLNLVNFRVLRFHVLHLTHETFKLCLQNTLNMSKTARVYFGALHEVKEINNSMEKTDDDMMNLPKSLHGEDMSLTNRMMNMTLTRSP